MEEIAVGLIGAGALGAVHAEGLSRIAGCRLSAVAANAVSAPVLAAVAAAGARIVDPATLFDTSVAQVVLIATPTDTHTEYACQAIKAGQSVFCEKPVARTLADAELIRDLAKTADAKVAVGHVVRYFPEYAAARELVSRGVLGRPLTARLARLNTGPADLAGWYGDVERSGGVLLDMAIHDIDWCLWAFGPVARVYAARAGGVSRDVASITLRHHSGVISYIDASWRSTGFETRLEICGTDGMYRTGGSGAAGFDLIGTESASSSYLPPGAAAPAPDDPYVMELKSALSWFAGGAAPRATVVEACEAVRVVEAAEESIRTAAPVLLEECAP